MALLALALLVREAGQLVLYDRQRGRRDAVGLGLSSLEEPLELARGLVVEATDRLVVGGQLLLEVADLRRRVGGGGLKSWFDAL